MHADLVERAMRGDQGAFASLAAEWVDRCYALAYRVLRDHRAAQDGAPASIQAEHLANVQTGRDTVAVLEHGRQLLLDGKVSDALAVDAATGPLNRTFEAFETKYGLAACA